MAKVNKNFRLGLNRQELIKAANILGMQEHTAKKANTKRLETFVANKFGAKGSKLPELSQKELADIQKYSTSFGAESAIKYLGYKIGKAVGGGNQDSFLRASLQESFRVYYSGTITSAMIDELVKRIPDTEYQNQISGIVGLHYNYETMFEEYAEELALEEFKNE